MVNYDHFTRHIVERYIKKEWYENGTKASSGYSLSMGAGNLLDTGVAAL